MFARTAVTVASVLVAFAAAQNSSSAAVSSGTSSTFAVTPTSAPGSEGFNINNVSSSDRFNWCHAQLNTCPEICGGSVSSNQCDQNTLTYQCTCSNGSAPDVAAYQQTIPFYVCQATFEQCINSHPNDAQGQQTCKDNEQCGSLNASSSSAATSSAAASSAASTSASSATAASTGSTSGSATASSSSSSSTHSGVAGKLSPEVGMGLFAGLFLAAFKLLL